MKHPALCPWVEMSADRDGLHITDTKRGKRYKVPLQYETLLRGLDGRTPPRRLAPELTVEARAGLLEELKQNRLTRQKPFCSREALTLSFTVPLARPTEGGRMAAHIFNRVLLKLWLPSLVLAVWSWLECSVVLLDNHLLLGSIAGLILGMLLHELSHACACIAYGGRVHGCGLMLWCLLPCAFVELDDDPIRSPLQKAQVFAAGAEMNLYLAALFLLLAGCHPLLGSPCFCAAMTNLILALVNLTLTPGLDGMQVLSALMGVENLSVFALKVLTDRQSRRHLRRRGFSGAAAFLFCGMGAFMLLSLPLVLIVNLTEVLLWVL